MYNLLQLREFQTKALKKKWIHLISFIFESSDSNMKFILLNLCMKMP